MFNKIVILITIIATGTIIQAFPLIGVWIEQTAVTDKIMNISRWTTSQLAKHTGLDGDYTFLSVRNIQTQTLSEGINYKLTLDVLIKTLNNNYIVSFIYIIIKFKNIIKEFLYFSLELVMSWFMIKCINI
jgi:hypothetical protein